MLALCWNPWRANCVFWLMFKTSWRTWSKSKWIPSIETTESFLTWAGWGGFQANFCERTFFEGDLTGRITHLPRSRSRCTPGSRASRHQTHRWKSVCTCGDFGKHPPKSRIPHVLPPRNLRTGFKKKQKHRYLYLDSLDLETSPCPHLNAKALWETVPFK